MVLFGYVWHELWRRRGRTVVTALGLAVGVGLVMGVVGLADGLSQAEGRVLSPLSTVGVDVVVARTAATGGPEFFAGGASAPANVADQAALADNGAPLIAELSRRGVPGSRFSYDLFQPGSLVTFPQSTATEVGTIRGVRSAEPALVLQVVHVSGTVPVGGGGGGSGRGPAPLTAAEQGQVGQCLVESGAPAGVATAGASTLVRRFAATYPQCFPLRFQQYEVQQGAPRAPRAPRAAGPRARNLVSRLPVAGVDPQSQRSGLVTKAQLDAGSWFSSAPSGEVLVDAAYARARGIGVGRSLVVDGVRYTVAGLVSPTLPGVTPDVFFGLDTLQTASLEPGRINEVLVSVPDQDQVLPVVAAIETKLPGAEVFTADQLSVEVSGTLSAARRLVSDLRVVIEILVLAAALLIATLATLSTVTKRVREIGTLRAIGWSRRRVVAQLMAEMLGIGMLGAVLGVLIGFGVCAVIDAVGPALSYSTVSAVAGSGTGALVGRTTVATVQLHTAISALTVAAAVVIAVVGALVAGMAGAWRAARVAPASALRDLG